MDLVVVSPLLADMNLNSYSNHNESFFLRDTIRPLFSVIRNRSSVDKTSDWLQNHAVNFIRNPDPSEESCAI